MSYLLSHKRHFKFLKGVQAIFERFRTRLILYFSASRRGTLSTSVAHFFSSLHNFFIWMRFTSTFSRSLPMWRAHMLFHAPLWVLYPFGGHFRNHPTTFRLPTRCSTLFKFAMTWYVQFGFCNAHFVVSTAEYLTLRPRGLAKGAKQFFSISFWNARHFDREW